MSTQYKKGDKVEFDSRVNQGKRIPGKVIEPNVSHGFVRIKWVKPDGKERTGDIESHRVHPVRSSTHKYKVGDIIIIWSDHPNTTYLIEALRDKGCYDFVDTQTGEKYTNYETDKWMTELVTPYTSPDYSKPKQIDKCKWATKQPIDVEPVDYRVYGGVTAEEQHTSSQAIVIKRAQHHGIRAVPSCTITGKLINIIGESKEIDGKWRAEAFLYCEDCDKS
jgi:TusA-related sulfurtransferase